MPNRPRVTALGSLNMDIAVTVPHLPGPGATALGGAASYTPGGKGANQAVAAARLGGAVRMAGCLGADDFGARLRSALNADGVDTSAVTVHGSAPTGLAMITIDAGGENMITVAPGANHEVGEQQVRAALDGEPDILVLSAEIPLAAVAAALRSQGRKGTVTTMLNLAPAPARDDALALLAEGVDWLVVNEPEAAAILGRQVRNLDEARDAARELITRGPRNAVVTAGSEGVAAATQAEVLTVPAFKAEAVDTVGAGDTFTGALAVTLAAGLDPRAALEAAAAAAATKVTRPGAQAGMPVPGDIEILFGYRWPLDLTLGSGT